jgi:hypothetical protein
VAFTGKHPSQKKKDRCYTDKPPRTGDYGAAYGTEYLKLDIDDLNHKTGQLEDPIHGKARSEVVTTILDALGIKYNGIITEHGKHLFFRVPERMEQKNKINWYCPLGIKCEWKFSASDDHIPLKINGVKRKFFKGSIDNEEIDELDELPIFLYPLQKGNKPFEIDFPEGGRTQKLGAYLFYLVSRGYSAEQIFEIVRLMNQYVFDNPIPDDLLNSQILNDSTFDKLIGMESSTRKKEVSLETFGDFLSEYGMRILYNELSNIVEFENIPEEYKMISDIQNQMPTQLHADFQKYVGRKASYMDVVRWISLEADKNSYNPVKDYLKEITWDGVDRFPEIFAILGVQSEFEQSLVRKWFYQTAALPFNTLEHPIQPEGVLILQGNEGIGKTRFFLLMTPVPIWFQSLDKELTTKNKDILIQMLSSWIGEIGEVDRTFKANRSDVKNFMTLTKDSIRKPYAREPVTKARATSFCGTTNKAEFLNDDTGFRRWWVIQIQQKISMGYFVQPDNLHQFWSQCYAAYCSNPQCFRLTEEERRELEERNKEVMETLPAEDELRLRLDFEAPLETWRWIQPSALKNLPEYDVGRYTTQELGAAIRAIMRDVPGIQRKRNKKGTAYFIPPSISNTDRYRNRLQGGSGLQ